MVRNTLQRLVKQLDKLKPEGDAARLKTRDYARRLARMIRQLRERGYDADRAAATVAIADEIQRGAYTALMEAQPHTLNGLARCRGTTHGSTFYCSRISDGAGD